MTTGLLPAGTVCAADMELETRIPFEVGFLNKSALCCSGLMDQDTTDSSRTITHLHEVKNSLFPPSLPFPSFALPHRSRCRLQYEMGQTPEARLLLYISADLHHRWNFFFLLVIPHNPSTSRTTPERREGSKTKPQNGDAAEKNRTRAALSFPPGWDLLRAGSR